MIAAEGEKYLSPEEKEFLRCLGRKIVARK